MPVLVVEDDPGAQLVYDRFLRDSTFQPLAARSLREARLWLKQVTPAAIVLDLVLQGEDTWKFLAELKSHDQTSSIPVVVISTVDDQRKGLALGADDYAVKPIDRDWLLRRLEALTAKPAALRVLIIDDDAGARYVLRRHLAAESFDVIEAHDGAEGLAMAAETQTGADPSRSGDAGHERIRGASRLEVRGVQSQHARHRGHVEEPSGRRTRGARCARRRRHAERSAGRRRRSDLVPAGPLARGPPGFLSDHHD